MENMENQDFIMITDEQGVEHRCSILFTYHNDENDKDYVVVYKDEDVEENTDEEVELYAFIYTVSEDGIGDLFEIEDEAENEMIDSVISQFLADQEESEDE